MNVVLDYRETTHGSFKAWGSEFRYDYNKNKSALDILHQDTEGLLARLKLDQDVSSNALSYVQLVEKASQINALMFSNNATVKLMDTMRLERLQPIIKNIVKLSRHAYDLQTLNLDRFCHFFADEFDLQSVKIKKFTSRNENNSAFFIARMLTHHDNGISVRACTMTGIMAAMSDRTLRDLITMEFGHRFKGSAHNLLNASSKLSSLSYILDENFVPESKISGVCGNKNQTINMH